MVFFLKIRFCLLALVLYNVYTFSQFFEFGAPKDEVASVTVAVLVRNKAHTLPYFLTSLDLLEYPKKKLNLWVYSDHNLDKSIEILKDWKMYREKEYQAFYLATNDDEDLTFYPDEKNVSKWTVERYKHVIYLRELALSYARNTSSDYLFMLDADVILTEPKILTMLLSVQNSIVVSPMLDSEGNYTNFWTDIMEGYKPVQSNQYKYILHRIEYYVGYHYVSVSHTALLISMKHKFSKYLTFNPAKVEDYNGPIDDTIAFSSKLSHLGLFITLVNLQRFGYVTKPCEISTPENEIVKLTNIKMAALSEGITFPIHPVLTKYISYPKPSKFNMSEIFMINLARRPEKLSLMKQSFKELGMDVVTYNAVDGKYLTMEKLREMGAKIMPQYIRTNRRMTAGEVGCFLSHYNIWKTIVAKKYKQVLIMEDDVKFQPYFLQNFAKVMEEAKVYGFELLYLGRQKQAAVAEIRLSRYIVRPMSSVSAIGYVLTYEGALKLLKAKPLLNMLPVDHFLPLMFNAQTQTYWTVNYPKEFRTLQALSAEPAIMVPANFAGASDVETIDFHVNEPYIYHVEF